MWPQDFNSLYAQYVQRAEEREFEMLKCQRWIQESYERVLTQHDAQEISDLERMWSRS